MLFNYLGYHSRLGGRGDLGLARHHARVWRGLRLADRENHQPITATLQCGRHLLS